MTITFNSDCTEFSIYSEYLTSGAINNMDSITLKSSKNCSSVVTTVDLTEYIESTEDNIYTNTVEEHYVDEKLCDGIYYFELEMTYTIESTTTTVTETACVFINCNTKCKVVDYYAGTSSAASKRNVMDLYSVLLLGMDCDTCSCEAMCTIYNDLLYELKLSGNDTSCGSC